MVSTGIRAVVAQAGSWHHMDSWGGGWMWLWGSLMALTWIAVVTAAAWFLLRSGHGAGRGDGGSRRAREILDERLASGELSLEEYRERRDALT